MGAKAFSFTHRTKVFAGATIRHRRWWYYGRLALNRLLTIGYFDRLALPDLNFSNRLVRTRTPGGVAGEWPSWTAPMPISGKRGRWQAAGV
jgi:hypothetical protein